ncbi:Short-chain dehydrogenase/reductase SDR [Penicillium lagena]|uniref:Short-chain dehydrogenase/reductase SDR n=1 Tax=Penicillium lagena TaxID=94218 RepID=UPI002540EACF|nr:Short-chain dehydrogenase/reductase SDR [Penicillium lagena]KAJ5605216.1 Short-chain dehydrogenase/reductase SDR [Penicillium lagena]
MSLPRKKVLITGCSDGGLGCALAIAFKDAGLHVYATARDPSKMSEVKLHGIETLTLDVQSSNSVTACVSKLSSLDILVNNAGGGYSMPFSDLSIPEAKRLFDLNVWSYLTITQAFLPLLLRSKGMVVNHTSAASMCTVPFQSAYNASKAAIAAFSDSQRLELEPFGIKVVDLKTGMVSSHFQQNLRKSTPISLPTDSIYNLAKEKVEDMIRAERLEQSGMPAEQWAKLIVNDLLSDNPPSRIWRGNQAEVVRDLTTCSSETLESIVKDVTEFRLVEELLHQ